MSEEKKIPQEDVDADLPERQKEFNKELAPLLGKYELALGALPKILPNGTIGADPVIFSMRGKEELLKQQQKNEGEQTVAPTPEITNPDK